MSLWDINTKGGTLATQVQHLAITGPYNVESTFNWP
jgi:hypothetical protein